MDCTFDHVIRPYQENSQKKGYDEPMNDEHIIKKSPAFTTIEPGMGGTGFWTIVRFC